MPKVQRKEDQGLRQQCTIRVLKLTYAMHYYGLSLFML